MGELMTGLGGGHQSGLNKVLLSRGCPPGAPRAACSDLPVLTAFSKGAMRDCSHTPARPNNHMETSEYITINRFTNNLELQQPL